jgi:alpha/beta superfamily hydrolase
MEEHVFFKGGDIELEGLIARGDSGQGVVITHPHPLYGGDMHSYVVEAIVSAYGKKDYTTLRFNFRGVGRSQGSHDNGFGEQDDVRAAVSYLSETGIDNIDLAGYSFGAWVNAHAVSSNTPVRHMVMVSPPVGFRKFEAGPSMPCLRLIITGNRDDIAPAEAIEKMLPQWNPDARLEIIEGADHFYAGYFNEVESILLSHL